MLKRAILLSTVGLMAATTVFSQDREVRREREERRVREDDDDDRTVLHPRASRTSVRVERVVKKKTRRINYAPNIIRFTPLTAWGANTGYVGLGLSYERILDKDGKVGFNLPISLGMNTQNGSSNYPYNNNIINNYGFSVAPGVKFYPAGQRRVTYGFGASLFFSGGSADRYETNYNSGVPYTQRVDKTVTNAGMMFVNSLQFNVTPKLNAGFELGLGPSYWSQTNVTTTNSSYTINDGIRFYAQIGFHLGYRF